MRIFKRILILSACLFILGLGCLSWAYWVEPNRLKITRITLPVPQWKGTNKSFRIALVGDLHAAPGDHYKLRRVVRTIMLEQPDIALLVGDYVKGMSSDHSMPLPEIMAELEPLGYLPECSSVLGNHDEAHGGDEIKINLKTFGICVVEGANVPINGKNASILLGGIPDLDSKPVNWKNIPLMSELSDEPCVFLSHTPDAIPMLSDKGIHLLLCGHTHGGQICLPGGIPIVTSCRGEGKKYASGLYKKDNMYIFTTRGIGMSILPLRFFCPPEIAIITLSGQEDEAIISSENAPRNPPLLLPPKDSSSPFLFRRNS